MLNLLKRKSEIEKGSFLEHIGEILLKMFKKLGEFIIILIKRIIKEVWH